MRPIMQYPRPNKPLRPLNPRTCRRTAGLLCGSCVSRGPLRRCSAAQRLAGQTTQLGVGGGFAEPLVMAGTLLCHAPRELLALNQTGSRGLRRDSRRRSEVNPTRRSLEVRPVNGRVADAVLRSLVAVLYRLRYRRGRRRVGGGECSHPHPQRLLGGRIELQLALHPALVRLPEIQRLDGRLLLPLQSRLAGDGPPPLPLGNGPAGTGGRAGSARRG